MTPFAQRLSERIRIHSPLCVGLDPSVSILKACALPDSAEGALQFAQRVLDATEGAVAIVKPQSAFFERFGSAGWKALEGVIAHARTMGVLVLLDGKRGDIETTAEAYAHAFFTPGSASCVDAVTAHAYLGFGALRPFLAFGERNGGGVFIVVRSSNPEGEPLQNARLADGATVAQHLAQAITEHNRTTAGSVLGGVGAVVGATCVDANEIAERLPLSFLLAPGVGAQGATIADVKTRMPSAHGRVLPSVSRGILAQGSSRSEISQAITDLKRQAMALVG